MWPVNSSYFMPGKNRIPNDNKQREKNQGKEEAMCETAREKWT